MTEEFPEYSRSCDLIPQSFQLYLLFNVPLSHFLDMELETQVAISFSPIPTRLCPSFISSAIHQHQHGCPETSKTKPKSCEHQSRCEANRILWRLCCDEDITADNVGTVPKTNHPRQAHCKILLVIVSRHTL